MAVGRLLEVVIPHFPLVIRAFAELLDRALGMKVAPGHKMRFFQLPQPENARHAIGTTDSLWNPYMTPGVRYTHETYRVAGADVGDRDAINHILMAQVAEWHSILRMVTECETRQTQATYMAIKMAFTPMTKFGYHFQCQPVQNTDELAQETAGALLRAFALLIATPWADVAHAPESNAICHRIFSPVEDGGIGFADPTHDRIIAFGASFINTLPLLLSNPMLGHVISNSPCWQHSTSDTLKDAYTIINYLANLVSAETDRRGHDEPGTEVGKTIVAAVTIGGRIDVQALAEASHKHAQRVFASYFYPHRTALHRDRHDWTDAAVAARAASTGRGAGVLANAYVITKDTKLSNDQAIFWLCHKLVLELPFLGPNPACHQSCSIAGPGRVGPNHALFGLMRHGYHQASCSIDNTTTTRHNAVLAVLDRRFRRHCGVISQLGEHLQRDDNTRKSTDILMVFPNQPWRKATSGDYTCMCIFTSSYIDRAVANFAKVLEDKARIKTNHHGPWCLCHSSSSKQTCACTLRSLRKVANRSVRSAERVYLLIARARSPAAASACSFAALCATPAFFDAFCAGRLRAQALIAFPKCMRLQMANAKSYERHQIR